MIRVTIIGTGNVATVFYKLITSTTGLGIVQVFGRKKSSSIKPVHFSILGKDPVKKADVYIIAASDDSIPTVSKSFKKVEGLLVHTSGNAPLRVLPKNLRRGVFYPLMTISKQHDLDFKKVPICVEAEHKEDLELLNRLALSISDKVITIDSKQRKSLHLAAVFVNNFVNHLYDIGQNICLENQVPFDVLLPLIQETAKKMEILSPREAQTGPAKRGDINTMKEQLQSLKTSNQREIYTLLSQSIQQTYGEKL